ncbi:MAG: 7-carboxy-7-deazaguanine synthase QueE [Luteibaculaceae bacterium]
MVQDKKVLIDTGEMLPVMEHFYTVQGEGAYTGSPAYFIRLGGCDVGCHWCDVKESWPAEKHPAYTIDHIVDFVVPTKAKIVVITGGEPAMYNLVSLTAKLKEKGFRTHIETSGAYPLTGSWDWICFSPKKFKQPLDSVAQMADELKVVIYNKHDFKWAEDHAKKVPDSCRLFLQAEWDKRNEMYPLMVNYVQESPKWTISVQTHKYLDIP